MTKLLTVNVGFVTNSSSVVYHFPMELLADAGVRAFLLAFEIDAGFVGDDLWDRSQCGTLAVTREQKAETLRKLSSEEGWSHPGVDVEDDKTFVVVIGDEHEDVAKVLCDMLKEIAEKSGVVYLGDDYN